MSATIWLFADCSTTSASIFSVRPIQASGRIALTQSVKLGMKPRSSRTCCSPTQRVGMILPVDSVIVGPKTVSESQIPAACYLDSQSVSSGKPLAVIGVFLSGIGETVHGGSLSSHPCFTPTQITSFLPPGPPQRFGGVEWGPGP